MINCIIPVSGGKDSQTCLKIAIEHFGKDKVIGLFCDTGFEHPLTYEHIKNMSKMYGIEIITRCNGEVLDLCKKHNRFPSGVARFCTNELKIKVSKRFYQELAEKQGQGFEVWYGMRSGESSQRAKRYKDKISDELYLPHEILPSNYPKYLSKLGIKFRLPILEWSEREVYDFLGDEINPLYKYGFDRVGCFPCLAGGDKSKEKAFNFDGFGKCQFEKVKIIEKQLGKSVFTSKSGQERNNDKQEQLCFVCQI